MPTVGPLELAIVAVILIAIFGPKRLPELGRSLGRGMREFRTSVGRGEGPDQLPAGGEREEADAKATSS